MRVLVCGGRDYKNKDRVFSFLDNFHSTSPITLLIHGDAPGADTLADLWAYTNGIQMAYCPANWEKYGKRAGYIRNAAMLYLQPEVVIAFPGGKGTQMMVKLAQEAGVRVDYVR